MVVALVVMLRIAAGPLLRAADDGSTSRRVAVLTSALVPFLTVYALTGELKADRDQFINESYADEFFNGDSFITGQIADRTLATVTSWQVGLVVVVLVIRLLIDLLDLEERHTAWGLVQVVVEVTWLTWLATILTSRFWPTRRTGSVTGSSWPGPQDAWRSVTGLARAAHRAPAGRG